MGKPHKHAEFIKAKADGETIQESLDTFDRWQDMLDNDWEFAVNRHYRIKPEPPKYPLTRMTERERWDAITAAGISRFNIGTSRAEGADRLEHSPGDVTAAIANAAIARAIEDRQVIPLDQHVKEMGEAHIEGLNAGRGCKDMVPAAMLENVASAVYEATQKGWSTGVNPDIYAIIAKVKEGK